MLYHRIITPLLTRDIRGTMQYTALPRLRVMFYPEMKAFVQSNDSTFKSTQGRNDGRVGARKTFCMIGNIGIEEAGCQNSVQVGG